MALFVVAHGAWSAGWAWKKMHPLLHEAGHDLLTPTYTGLGERAHLANPSIDLETHIDDILNVLTFEDMRDVVLIGHSYGGMVATGVADRARKRIAQVVYLDAFAPKDGESLFGLQPPAMQTSLRDATRRADGWRIPPTAMPPDTPEADVAWATPRRVPQPIKCFEQKIRLGADLTVPRSYIYCRRSGPGDVFRQFGDRALKEGWRYFDIDASHNPHITAPDALLALFQTIVSEA